MKGISFKQIFACMSACFIILGCSLQAEPIRGTDPKYPIGAFLQAKIHATPAEHLQEVQGRILPGSQVKLSALVQNNGDMPSAPGVLQIYYALPKPLHNNPGSVFFKTEAEDIPSIPPGESLTVNFTTPHLMPSLFDYIRNDWATREYSAIVTIDNKESVAGSLPISFTAYYYEGEASTDPVRVTSAKYIKETSQRPSIFGISKDGYKQK